MKNTKNKILNTARNLFNELGYDNVTIRMIAQKLNISSGNLNYHYKKREDILEALYFEMVKVFDDRVDELEKQKFTFQKIKNDIKTSMERMIEYRFFWTDLYFLLSQNEKIRTHFEQAYKRRITGTQFLFNELKKENLLEKESFKNQHQLLIERLINFSNTWLYATSIYESERKNNPEYQATQFLYILFPYLTDSGKKKLKPILKSDS